MNSNGIFPKEIDDIIHDYARANYEKLGLATRSFIDEFEYGHAMTECLFTIREIIVNESDDHAIITMSSTDEDDEIYYSYCAMKYDEHDYYLDSDSWMQGGFHNPTLYAKKKIDYGNRKPWKSIYKH